MSNENAKVVVERTYRAGIEDIWSLWTTKEGFESWWGPQGFRADVQQIDARTGGTLEYEMVADTPEMIAAMKQMGRPPSHATHSRFTEVTPYSRLILTNLIDFLPGVATYKSNIVVDFIQLGDRVRMVVTMDPMHTPEFTRMQEEGFTSQLTKLDSRFGAH
ncbi:SRPBCC family protein [Myxococcus landrumensis]|uniref:SRPBCC domain-containing protein n=1 Tax=Myxococcus landrumensis TaxID=2813577 RepID=A0ABX7MY46_9BACT|nr:SRPBCC domain-containing protein [Myxococcus landrumus]QSQ11387.1 SRPBCC domain-containing protein [Myxococcus landrumus]